MTLAESGLTFPQAPALPFCVNLQKTGAAVSKAAFEEAHFHY